MIWLRFRMWRRVRWCRLTGGHHWVWALDDGSRFLLCSECGHEATPLEDEAVAELPGDEWDAIPWLGDKT